jgi:hypothetical protein
MNLKITGTVLFMISLLFVIKVHSQSREQWREAQDSTQEAPSPSPSQTDYQGTTPGGGNSLPRVDELKGIQEAYITWPGFMMLPEGGSRIFVQTTKPLKYTQKQDSKEITLSFADTKIFLSNNKNPLIMTYFNTPVQKVYVKQAGKRAELVIELKTSAHAGVVQTFVDDGYNYVFVDFPAGQYR